MGEARCGMRLQKALAEAAGDVEKAVDWLRRKDCLAAKKAGRVASQGLVALKIGNKQGAVIEINRNGLLFPRNEQFNVCRFRR